MQVLTLMTRNPICCTADTRLEEVARMMVSHHCGAVPVVDALESRVPVGIITDRDITCRSLGQGKDSAQMTARDCMSSPVVTVRPETSLEACCRIMEESQVRRVPVVDAKGRCSGIVAQADIAKKAPEHETAEFVRAISQSTVSASQVTLPA